MNITLTPDQAYLRNGKLEASPPPRFADIDSVDFAERFPGAATSVQMFISSLKPNGCIDNDFVLSAPRFSGKTETAFAVMKACHEKKIRAVYADYFSLLKGLSNADWSEDLLDKLGRYDLLIIDDFGASVFGIEREDAEVLLFRLIDQRYVQCLNTMILTAIHWKNVHISGYGVNSRIVGRVRGTIIETGWED